MINKSAAYKLLWIQLAIAVVIALLLLIFTDKEAAQSAVLGGLTYILPNAYFVKFAFRELNQQTPGKILYWFYVGEAGKLVLAGALFALIFALVKSLHVVVFFGVFIGMIIINLAGLALFRITTQDYL
ncbi:MAG: ATP synthase subunit I [Gammaproteobacteria bacterium]